MRPILFEIKQGAPGLDRFIGAWFCPGEPGIVVDVGPSRSVGRFVQDLKAAQVEAVDFVLLTHIHIDHAGGLAEFLEGFPMAKVICHEKAVPHLVDPSKLWEGSKKVLGEMAAVYGPIEPVPRDRIIPHPEFHMPGLEIIETPGHAVHHISYIYRGALFVGEAGGNFFNIEGLEYFRPATPPVFFPEATLNSIDQLLAREDMPIFYTHFGERESSRTCLKRSREQHLRWLDVISDVVAGKGGDRTERCVERLINEDPDLEALKGMDPHDQDRERFFIVSSVQGYLGYLKNLG